MTITARIRRIAIIVVLLDWICKIWIYPDYINGVYPEGEIFWTAFIIFFATIIWDCMT